MARLNRAVLRVLDVLYDFIGEPQSASSMDLTSPITRVHDVSREAELGTYIATLSDNGSPNAASGAYFTIIHDIVHAGATTEIDALGVYSNQDTGWASASWVPPNPLEETVWVINASMLSTNELGTSGYIGIDWRPSAGSGSGLAGQNVPYGVFGTSIPSGMAGIGVMPMGSQALPKTVPLHLKFDAGDPILIVTTASGADTIDVLIVCMRLPLGVLPPGLR